MEILKGSVYRSSLGAIIVFMVLTVICWGKAGYVCSRGERQKCVWKLTNTLLFIAGILNVLETTIVGRNVSEQDKKMYGKLLELGKIDNQMYKALMKGDKTVFKAIFNQESKKRQEVVLKRMLDIQ